MDVATRVCLRRLPLPVWASANNPHERCVRPIAALALRGRGDARNPPLGMGQGLKNPRFASHPQANTWFLPGFYQVFTRFFTRFITRFFPRFQIPGSLGFHSSPTHFPRILRPPSSRNPRFLVRASASRKVWFLLGNLPGFSRFHHSFY